MSDFSTSPRSHDLLLVGGGAAALGALCAMLRTEEAEDRSILMLDDAPLFRRPIHEWIESKESCREG